jgi:hypothetical protein
MSPVKPKGTQGFGGGYGGTPKAAGGGEGAGGGSCFTCGQSGKLSCDYQLRINLKITYCIGL